MDLNDFQNYQMLLIHSSFTCIYIVGIIMFLFSSNNLYSVGSYKFISILLILIVAELIKLLFTTFQSDYILFGRTDLNHLLKFRKKFIRIMKNGTKLVFASIGLTLIYYIFIVLFGAPLTTHYEETAMLSLTITTLTLVPSSLYIGIDNTIVLFTSDTQLLINRAVLDAVKLIIKFVLFGTWLGAFVFPLDWDRPWQAWPIPCTVGALFGYFTAHLITFVKASIVKFNNKNKKYETFKTC